MSDAHRMQQSLENLNSYIINQCKTNCVQSDLLHTISGITETLVATKDKTANELAALNQRMAVIETNLTNMQKDIAMLCKLVRDGNGQPSLMQRLNSVEIHSVAHADAITELNENASSIIASRSVTKSQIVSGIVAMAITAILAGLALAVSLVKG